jgi:hypothetical protein
MYRVKGRRVPARRPVTRPSGGTYSPRCQHNRHVNGLADQSLDAHPRPAREVIALPIDHVDARMLRHQPGVRRCVTCPFPRWAPGLCELQRSASFSAQKLLPGPSRNFSSSSVDRRPRMALRCGNLPNRSMMSLWACAYCVSSGSPRADMSSTHRVCASTPS